MKQTAFFKAPYVEVNHVAGETVYSLPSIHISQSFVVLHLPLHLSSEEAA